MSWALFWGDTRGHLVRSAIANLLTEGDPNKSKRPEEMENGTSCEELVQ